MQFKIIVNKITMELRDLFMNKWLMRAAYEQIAVAPIKSFDAIGWVNFSSFLKFF